MKLNGVVIILQFYITQTKLTRSEWCIF